MKSFYLIIGILHASSAIALLHQILTTLRQKDPEATIYILIFLVYAGLITGIFMTLGMAP